MKYLLLMTILVIIDFDVAGAATPSSVPIQIVATSSARDQHSEGETEKVPDLEQVPPIVPPLAVEPEIQQDQDIFTDSPAVISPPVTDPDMTIPPPVIDPEMAVDPEKLPVLPE